MTQAMNGTQREVLYSRMIEDLQDIAATRGEHILGMAAGMTQVGEEFKALTRELAQERETTECLRYELEKTQSKLAQARELNRTREADASRLRGLELELISDLHRQLDRQAASLREWKGRCMELRAELQTAQPKPKPARKPRRKGKRIPPGPKVKPQGLNAQETMLSCGAADACRSVVDFDAWEASLMRILEAPDMTASPDIDTEGTDRSSHERAHSILRAISRPARGSKAAAA